MTLLKKSLLALSLLAGASALSVPAAADQIQPPAPACNRACLENIAEAYLKALVTHDPTKGPIAKNARYTENSVVLNLPDGLWRTASGVGPYRLFIADPKMNTIAFQAKVQENGAPILLSTRLVVDDGKITRIEAMVARANATGGARDPRLPPAPVAPGATPPAPPRGDQLGDRARPQFFQTLAPGERRSREDMVVIANSYFSALENNDGSRKPPFAPTCHRLENGNPTTNNPVPASGVRGAGNMGCAEGFATGNYRIDTRLRFRRYLAIDEERGLVYARIAFDHDGTVREYTNALGQVQRPGGTAPFTWDIAEVFQIKNGMIDQVEALLVANPYGVAPNWDDGIKMPSYGY